MNNIPSTFVEHLLSECLKDKIELSKQVAYNLRLEEGLKQLQEDNIRQMNTMVDYQREITLLKSQLESSK